MRKGVSVLLALLFTRAAAAWDGVSPPSHETGTGAEAAPVARLRLPPPESFRLFPQLAPEAHIELAGASESRRSFHRQGDPDSVFTLGSPTPGGELHLQAAIEVNEIFLKALPPDPLVQPNDSRTRAPGSFQPFDTQGHNPYQLRLGARLVW
jgi:hypothetical protein